MDVNGIVWAHLDSEYLNSRSTAYGSVSCWIRLVKLGGLICHKNVELPGIAMQYTSSGVKSFMKEYASFNENRSI